MEYDGAALGLRFLLSPPFTVEDRKFHGREAELQQCFACWSVDGQTKVFLDDLPPLHFRLEGPPGVGKNEIVYELARQLRRPLYVIQGHEELTPEDLALVLVPDASQSSATGLGFRFNASPLVSALRKGGLFFFDEINRVPERTLAPLASVLDDRRRIYSALVARDIPPPDEPTRALFRFCCAMNPASARGSLPEYIDERTLPIIRVDYFSLDDLATILQDFLRPPKELLACFRSWYEEDAKRQLSTRQARTLIQYAMSISKQRAVPPMESVREAGARIGLGSKSADSGAQSDDAPGDTSAAQGADADST